jgi:hypothetical protein
MGLIRKSAYLATGGAVAPHSRKQRTALKQLAALQGASPDQVRQTGGRNDYDSFLTGTPRVTAPTASRPASRARSSRPAGDAAQWRAEHVPGSKEYRNAHPEQRQAEIAAAQAQADAVRADAEARKAEAEAVKAQAATQARQDAAAEAEAKRQRRQARKERRHASRTRVVQWANETKEARRQAAIDNAVMPVMPPRVPKTPKLKNLVK